LYREAEGVRAAIVVDGLVRVFLSSGDGRQATVRYARAHEALGLPMLVAGPADVGAESVSVTHLAMFPVESLRDEIHASPEFAWVVAEEIAGNLYEVLDEMALHAFGSVREKVARHLLDLARADDDGRLSVSVTQAELADAVGSVREVVARTLGQFRRDGVVATSAHGITLLDAHGLHEASLGRE
jgi:CRP/FNR family transcriptional regulator